MIPGVLLVGPYFKMLSLVGLYNTLLGLILSQITITLPFSIWMLKGYVDTVPSEIDQAAMVDGASRTRTFMTVVLPSIVPGLVATIIFAFLLSWGDLLWALCLINAQGETDLDPRDHPARGRVPDRVVDDHGCHSHCNHDPGRIISAASKLFDQGIYRECGERVILSPLSSLI